MLEYAIRTVLRQARPDMMVMFGFEFAVLTILSTSTMARYALSLVEIYITRQQKRAKLLERRAEIRAEREQMIRQRAALGAATPSVENLPTEDDIDEMELDVSGWEEKGRWVFYLDLITDFLKLVVYLSFFAILFTFYGLPIHILRDVVMTMRSFAKRIIDFIRYRNATRDMNQRYPDATAEEIAREDVCIICREEMQPWVPAPAANNAATPVRPARPIPERLRAKKLPCGHLLHFACLRSWLERQQNCPTCRQPVATGARGNIRPFVGRGVAAGGQRGGDQQQGANDAGGAGGENRGRMWFLNFGPLRIGFGAGRGDMLQNVDLAQGQGQGQAAQAPAANQNPPAGQAPRTSFGFGTGRPPAPAATPVLTPGADFNHRDVQQIVYQLEQQVSQEINNLMNTADQLQIIRTLHNELARLRGPPANPPNNIGAGSGPSTAQPNTPQTQPLTGRAFPSGTSAITTVTQRYVASNPQYNSIPSGDSRLPEGLTIPQGWTLVPMYRLQQAGQSGDLHNATTPNAGASGAGALSPSSTSPQPPSSSLSPLLSPNPTTPTPTTQPSSQQQENNITGVRPSSSPDFLRPNTTYRPPTVSTTQDPSPGAATSTAATNVLQQQQQSSPSRASPLQETSEETRPLFNRFSAPKSLEEDEDEDDDEEDDEEDEEEEDEDGEEGEYDDGGAESNGHTISGSSPTKGKGRAVTVEDEADSE
ncbi:E3 ubiquitin-protein ligase synoviolin-A [Arthroderma uncinatum]|uniref:E3 ubiquitin-protein ligase synoviolin-A n=1 Tax=Arthroderma uncinatum TaxID=74035 RepID=UPI00144A5B9F|nr:E3 ubiquitin-protein ligase synoviolin-A [Arthroderma uncinatum]KAF3482070.1 E3 ubiquitin-protein ligase synoviolin-A [Arthroderma uncinatum]